MHNLSGFLSLDYCCLQICPMKTHMALPEVSILFVTWSVKKAYFCCFIGRYFYLYVIFSLLPRLPLVCLFVCLPAVLLAN